MSATSLPAKYGESSLSLLNHLIASGHHVADPRESRDLNPNAKCSCTVASTTSYTPQSARLRATTWGASPLEGEAQANANALAAEGDAGRGLVAQPVGVCCSCLECC